MLNLERRLQRLCEDLPALDLRLGSALGPLIGAARALQQLFASAVPRADGRGGRAMNAAETVNADRSPNALMPEIFNTRVSKSATGRPNHPEFH